MAYVSIVTVLALLEYQIFGLLVGRARGRYGIAAPAVSGNEIIEEEATILREVARRLLNGESMRSSVADLRRRGVPTSANKSWTENSLKRVLVNPRLAGLKTERGKLVEAAWEPILDLPTHKSLVALLDDPARKQKPGSKDPKYLLSGGFLACGRVVDDSDGTHQCAITRSGRNRRSAIVARAIHAAASTPRLGRSRMRVGAPGQPNAPPGSGRRTHSS